MSKTPSELSVFGAPVTVLPSYKAAIEFVQARIASGQHTFCAALNPPKVYRAMHEAGLMQVLRGADMRICDGVGVSWATLLLYGKWTPRITGIQLFLDLVEASVQQGWKIFLLGASPESNEAARLRLAQRNPGIRIVGWQDGFFDDSDEVVESINASGADLLFVAMGSPRQEMWISEQLPRLKPAFCMGVGGSLDAVSGTAKWAPRCFRVTGTEWLFRIITQPRLLGRFKLALLFAWEVLRAALPPARAAGLRQD